MDLKIIVENLIDPFLSAGELSLNLREKGLIKELVEYADSELNIRAYSKDGVKHCEKRLMIQLKAEIARQIWQENGFFSVYNEFDTEFQTAFKALEK